LLSTIARDIDCGAVNVTVLTIDSATKLPPEADGAVVVTGSHGAIYAAYLSAKAGVRAAIHHDAGIGLDEARVGGLAYAEKLGLAMAAIATESARIGDASDLRARGRVSRANVQALACGVALGMSCGEAGRAVEAGAMAAQAATPAGRRPHRGRRHPVSRFSLDAGTQ
jgi:hypothetical protein